jgi:hypothetical protein
MDPTVWGALPHDLLAIAAHHLGMKQKAIEQGEIALQLEPQNERFIANLAYYRE